MPATEFHPLLEEVFASSSVPLPDGSTEHAHSFIPRDACELLYRVIAANGALRGLEVGMAFGVATLCMADALDRNRRATGGEARLISIDPNQRSQWKGAALAQLARAGLSSVGELREEPSHLALPKLVERGERLDVAFIDGWPTFDQTIIDFFYIDQLLRVGGILVVNDIGWPSVHAAMRFVLANRDYELLETLPMPPEQVARGVLRVKRAMKRVLRPLARTDRDPLSEHERRFRAFDEVHIAAFRKRDNDRRPFDHFQAF